jgi:hypothetical protein
MCLVLTRLTRNNNYRRRKSEEWSESSGNLDQAPRLLVPGVAERAACREARGAGARPGVADDAVAARRDRAARGLDARVLGGVVRPAVARERPRRGAAAARRVSPQCATQRTASGAPAGARRSAAAAAAPPARPRRSAPLRGDLGAERRKGGRERGARARLEHPAARARSAAAAPPWPSKARRAEGAPPSSGASVARSSPRARARRRPPRRPCRRAGWRRRLGRHGGLWAVEHRRQAACLSLSRVSLVILSRRLANGHFH